VIKGEISDRQRTILYLAECIQSLTADETSPSSASTFNLMKRFEDVTQRYHVLAGEVSDHCDALITLLPQWKKYSDDVSTLDDWLVKRKAEIHELKTSGVDKSEDFCQVRSSLIIVCYRLELAVRCVLNFTFYFIVETVICANC